MKKIIIFSRHIGYNAGGAEKSVLAYALEISKNVLGLISLYNNNKSPIKLNSKLCYHGVSILLFLL